MQTFDTPRNKTGIAQNSQNNKSENWVPKSKE